MGMYMYNVAWCLSQLTVPEMDVAQSPNVIYCSPQLFIFIEPIYTCVKLVFTKD
jgi:hypothetical protein